MLSDESSLVLCLVCLELESMAAKSGENSFYQAWLLPVMPLAFYPSVWFAFAGLLVISAYH